MVRNSRKICNLFGIFALLFWTIEAVIVSGLARLPLFEILTFVFCASFLLTAIRLTLTKRWHIVKKQPFWVWPVGVLGICGSDLVYIWAFEYAPAAHVDLIDYTWPFLVIVFSCFLPNEKLKVRDILGA